MLGSLINKHISTLDKSNKHNFNQKILELCHTGKFLITLNENYQILRMCEEPDFIIENNNNQVGIEHVIFVDDSRKKIEGSIKNLFDQAEIDFSNKYPDKHFLVNIFLKDNSPVIKKGDIPALVPIINNVINTYISTGELIENNLIEHLFHMPHSQTNYAPNMGAWAAKILTNDMLERVIQKKDELLPTYISKSGIKEHWLLIVIGSLGGSAYQLNSGVYNDVNSSFTRIYILEDFKNEITRIK